MDDASDTPAQPQSTPRRFSSSRSKHIQRHQPSHERLREHDFFKNRSPKLLDVLQNAISVEVFLPGVEIVTEGEEGSCMYFMSHGEVEVLVGPDRKRVATLKDGSIFGEMALLGHGKRAATIRTLSLCDCRVINAHAFYLALKRFPAEKVFFQQLAKKRREEIKQKTGITAFRRKPRDVSEGVPDVVRKSLRKAKDGINERRSPTPISSDHIRKQDEVPSLHSPVSLPSCSSAVDRRGSSQLCCQTALDSICFREPTLELEPTFDVNKPLQNVVIAPSSAPAHGTIHNRNTRRPDVPTTSGRRFSGGVSDVSIEPSNLSGSSYASNLSCQQTGHGRRWSDSVVHVRRFTNKGSCSTESPSHVRKAVDRRRSLDLPASEKSTDPTLCHERVAKFTPGHESQGA